MPKTHTLTHAQLASLARTPTRRYQGTYFSLSVAPLPGSDVPRAACVVSKKVSLRASDRNLIKRRCRAVLSSKITHIESPVALVLNAKREALSATFAQLRDDIDRLLSRIRSIESGIQSSA